MGDLLMSYYPMGGQLLRRANNIIPERPEWLDSEWGQDESQKPIPGVNVGTIDGIPRTTNSTTNAFAGTTTRVFRDIDFTRKLTLAAGTKHLKLINCEVWGLDGSGECISAFANDIEDIELIDCTIGPPDGVFPHGYVGTSNLKMGVRGHHITMKRVKFRNVIDGFRPRNLILSGGVPIPDADVAFKAFGCWIDDLFLASPDTGQADRQSHNDCIQIDMTSGMKNLLVRGNWLAARARLDVGQADHIPTFEAGHAWDQAYRTGGNTVFDPAANPAFTTNFPQYEYGYADPLNSGAAASIIQIVATNPGHHDNIVLDRNWAMGGSVFINSTAGNITNMHVTNNRIGRNFRRNAGNGRRPVVLVPSGLDLDYSGNVWADTGLPADVYSFT